MKRYLLLLFCMAASLIFLMGCGSSNDSHSTKETDWEPTIYDTVNDLDGVTVVA